MRRFLEEWWYDEKGRGMLFTILVMVPMLGSAAHSCWTEAGHPPIGPYLLDGLVWGAFIGVVWTALWGTWRLLERVLPLVPLGVVVGALAGANGGVG